MRLVLGLIAIAAAVVPALGAVQAAAPEGGSGWPAIICAVVAAVLIFALSSRRT